MGILSSLSELLNGPPAPPPVRPLPPPAAPAPKAPASLLDSLLAPAPAPPPADLAELLWAKPGVDIKGAALARMAAAGQLTPSDRPMELPVPKLPSTVGLFHKINKAGPKSRKKEEPQIISAMDAPDGGIRADELLAKLGISAEDYSPKSRFAEARRRAGVQHSSEFDRIMALPRRPMNLDGFPDLTMEFRKPGGTMELWKIQSAMLHEGRLADGLFAAAGVGHGKCVLGDTEIYDAGSGRRRQADHSGSFRVSTMDGARKAVVEDATAFPSGKKECVRVKLGSGLQVSLSTDHPILTQRGWVHASELRQIDMVATARKAPQPEKFAEYTDDEILFLAYMAADGECSNNRVFTNMNAARLDEFKAVVARMGGESKFIVMSGQAEEWIVKNGRDSLFRRLLKRTGLNCLSKDKRLPPDFYGLTDKQIALFLNRFIACDGHIDLNNRLVDITLASELLIRDLRFLLLRLGICSRSAFRIAHSPSGEAVFPAWRLTISGEAAVVLLKLTGSIVGKETETKDLLEAASSIVPNTNVDVVPIKRKQLQEICDELGFPKGSGGNLALRKGHHERSEARTYLGVTQGYVSRRRFEEFCKHYNYHGKYSWYAESDVFWDSVVSVKPLGIRPVYDLSVPATGCFVANGIVVHNTIASLLLPVAMRSKKCVLLVPPQLRRKTLYIDIPALYKHWNIPTNLIRVIAYSELSNAKCSKILEELQPDLIVADECHNLRHKTAARTKRFLRYMKEHPECRFAGMSGTITRDSILDYQHLIELALRKNSPLPAHYGVLIEWAEALDVSDDPAAPGVLLNLCTAEERASITGMAVADSQPTVRAGFRRRLTETQGVIATEEGAIGTSLIINGLHPLVPAEVKVALDELRKKWEIDGEELIDAMSVSRVARELANGFFYRWVWPGGIKDFEWLGARAAWNKELRAILKLNRKGLDSPLEVINAIRAGKIRSETWDAWARVSDRPKPPTEAVWLSDYLIDAAIHWARTTCDKKNPGIIWYLWDDYGRRLALKGGFPFYGPGMKNDPSFADPEKEPVIVCSVAAHGTGKNLQKYCRNLFTTPMGGGVDWEQALARTHRPGQEADEVSAEVFLHTQEMAGAFAGALEDARYIEQTTPNKQKLLYAELLDIDGERY
jgi:hypothetical protein